MVKEKKGSIWNPGTVRGLRQHLMMSQRELARELGTRQQTISEWEVGLYNPRGTSARLLSMIAERAGFRYDVKMSSEQAGALSEPEGPNPKAFRPALLYTAQGPSHQDRTPGAAKDPKGQTSRLSRRRGGSRKRE